MASTFPVGSLAAPGSRVASDKKFESILSSAFISSFSFSKTPNVALRPTQRSLLISAMGEGLHFNKDCSSIKKLQFKDVNKLADLVGVATFGPKGRNVGAKLVTKAAGDGEGATAKSTKAELEDPVGAKSARQAVAKSKGVASDGMPRRYWNINLEEMMEAGVHFGHGTRKWNPKMAPYISAKRKGIHIINLTKTARFLSEACDLAFDAASRGKQFLIVGTKNKAADLVARAAIKARCHYVNKKWLGGMLTNWYTTETRLHRFRDLRTELKTGRLNRLPKRDAAVLKRQLSHLETYLGGIKYMTAVPDVVIIVDQQEEITALRECITLGIPTICLIDTNCNPDLADMCIPANDDAIASIRLILNKLVFAICEGRSSYVRKS